jgi:hypothetical protein
MIQLSKRQKRLVEKWLRNPDQYRMCPFEGDRCEDSCGVFFRKSKPTWELGISEPTVKCPCWVYPVKYVRRRARKWVSE